MPPAMGPRCSRPSPAALRRAGPASRGASTRRCFARGSLRSDRTGASSVAGLLEEVFGWEITAQLTQCANCGHVAECGALLAFVGGPGTVLRCSVCKEVVVRIGRTDRAPYVDARGASFFRLPGSPDI